MLHSKVFLEIGTCDFDTCLPLAKSGWSGYMVEADPRYAEAMSEQTKPYDVQVDNIAMSNIDGYVPFKRSVSIDRTSGDGWARGIGHVDSDNHLGEKLLNYSDNDHFRKDRIMVPCMTMDSYINKYKIKQIDFLKIDVEGHEANVLEGFSWDIKPAVIKIERDHIDPELLLEPLRTQGYTCWVERNDIYAII